MRSSNSCICFVRAWPTDWASIPMHWKIESSDGAPFFLVRFSTSVSLGRGRREKRENEPSSLKSFFNTDQDRIQVRRHI